MVNRKLKINITLDLSVKEDQWKQFHLITEENIKTLTIKTLEYLHLSTQIEEIEYGILLTNDKEIGSYNKKFRGKDNPTNTLSFPIEEHIKIVNGHVILGDIIFAFETIQREATEQTKGFYQHFYHLFLHSLLHLIGYDHEVEKDRICMENLEINILSKLGIGNPYE